MSSRPEASTLDPQTVQPLGEANAINAGGLDRCRWAPRCSTIMLSRERTFGIILNDLTASYRKSDSFK